MENLMRKVNFPEDAIREVLVKIDRLKDNGDWKRINELAEDIMCGSCVGKNLGEKLKLAENWEEELDIHKYMLDLLVLLRCWEILKGLYEQQNMSMDIYWNSLADMRCKLLECRDVYGVNGIFVGFWYDRFFDMTRFALGRLQFELEYYPYEKSYSEKGKTVKKGDVVINMHIPSDGPLTPEAVEAAFDRAAEFYKEQFPDGQPVFVVDSWMLDPDLIKILPEGNMKCFVQRFTIVNSKKEEKFLNGWRVFGHEWEKQPEALPRRTTLQQAIADYLRQGGRLGKGYGIFIR